MNKLILAAGFLTMLGSTLAGGAALAEEGYCRPRTPVYWNGERYCPVGMYCRDADDVPRFRRFRFFRRHDRDDFRRYDRDDFRRGDGDDYRRFDRDDRRFRDRDED